MLKWHFKFCIDTRRNLCTLAQPIEDSRCRLFFYPYQLVKALLKSFSNKGTVLYCSKDARKLSTLVPKFHIYVFMQNNATDLSQGKPAKILVSLASRKISYFYRTAYFQ